jgi:type II secretory pathway predicted ATPase ExeA
MYRQHFGLTQDPLGKQSQVLWDDGQLAPIRERFGWLLESPGLGLLTGEAGVGKTAVLRSLTADLNPHRYQLIYQSDTDFGRLDLYRSLALALGLEPAYRRAQLWRDLKARIQELADGKQVLPLWIIDEAQNLPREFFRDFPAFLNFAFDTRDLMSVWLVGLPELAVTLDRAPYAALSSRIQVRLRLDPVQERDRFAALIQHAFKAAGCHQTLLADSGIELLRQASQGRPRSAGLILRHALRLAVTRGLNHLPDELINQAIEEQRG